MLSNMQNTWTQPQILSLQAGVAAWEAVFQFPCALWCLVIAHFEQNHLTGTVEEDI